LPSTEAAIIIVGQRGATDESGRRRLSLQQRRAIVFYSIAVNAWAARYSHHHTKFTCDRRTFLSTGLQLKSNFLHLSHLRRSILLF